MPSGTKLYNIDYSDSVIKKDIPALPVKVKSMVKKAIIERLAVDPAGFGKPLRYNLSGQRKFTSKCLPHALLCRCKRTYSGNYIN
ncbi:MAG: type II toxin-antitoxin system RelE/ParE family toxin [Wolbachia endosymbiont of Fragariocoptes setiger]|nr:type II toxin-antitoxin system RelE/ParE family toxin [Wolbachia endosymbiont of Fragariocoptes setiger]